MNKSLSMNMKMISGRSRSARRKGNAHKGLLAGLLVAAAMVAGVALLAVALLFVACGKSGESEGKAQGAGKAPGARAAQGKVNLYIYSEYMYPELPAEFEKLTGLKLRVDVYEASEEMLAKLSKAGGVSQYDVVVAPNYSIPVMAHLNLIRPLDKAKIPNQANVSNAFANPPFDPGCKYSLPYQWGTVGLIYRKDKVPNFEPTWKMIFEEAKQPGPFIFMDEIRPQMAIALIALGYSANTTDTAQVKAAGDLMIKAKSGKKCLGFDGGAAGKNKVASGAAVMAIVYNGDAVRAMAEDKNIGFAVPDEGAQIWVDCMTIPAKAPNPEGACKFISFILDAKVGAKLSNFNRYATPNKASLAEIKPEDKSNIAIYPSEAQMKKLQYIKDLGKETSIYDETWTMVKSR